jgi:ligand-binding SRPBCC domain-containing protein
MPVICLTTMIQAPVDRCFDLSRSIDLHVLSAKQTNESAIAGITSGLIELNEEVTWRARHFGIVQKLTTRITAFRSPFFFEDTMVSGAFKKIIHKHTFEQQGSYTVMKDEFLFKAPFGLLGKVISRIILIPYMKHFLIQRNQTIKKIAESDKWKWLLTKHAE